MKDLLYVRLNLNKKIIKYKKFCYKLEPDVNLVKKSTTSRTA